MTVESVSFSTFYSERDQLLAELEAAQESLEDAESFLATADQYTRYAAEGMLQVATASVAAAQAALDAYDEAQTLIEELLEENPDVLDEVAEEQQGPSGLNPFIESAVGGAVENMDETLETTLEIVLSQEDDAGLTPLGAGGLIEAAVSTSVDTIGETLESTLQAVLDEQAPGSGPSALGGLIEGTIQSSLDTIGETLQDTSSAPSQPSITPPVSTPRVPPSWYADDCDECCYPITDRAINYMQIKVATFTSPQYSRRIKEDCANISDIVDEAVRNGHAMIHTIDPKNHSAKTLDNTRVVTKNDGSQVRKFNYNITVPVKGSNLNYLEVVEYMDLDIERMKSDFDFEMPTSLYNNMRTELFKMKVSSEKIIENGMPVIESSIFRSAEDGSTWDGPVHYHPEMGWMAGAKHTPLSHARLVKQSVPNLKIKNHAIKREILNLNLAPITANRQASLVNNLFTTAAPENVAATYISEPIESKDADGKTRFLFHIDTENLIKSQSRFPGLRDRSIYESGLIKSIQIFRQRGTDTKSKSRFGISKVSNDTLENQPAEKELVVFSSDTGTDRSSGAKDMSSPRPSRGKLRKNSRRVDKNFDGVPEEPVGSIEEMSIANLKNRRVFSVTDEEISKFTSGKFNYSVEIEVKDPTIDYMNQKLMSFCRAKDKLEELVSYNISNKSYDRVNRRFRDSYRSKKGMEHLKVIRDAIIKIVDIIELVKGKKKRKTVYYLMSIASLQSGSIEGLESLVNIMESIEQKLLKVLEGNLNIDSYHGAKADAKSKISSKSRSSSGVLTFKKDFNFLVNRNKKDNVGYDYVGAKKTLSFPSINASEYEERIREEKSKFYARDATSAKPNTRQNQRRRPRPSGRDYSFMTPAMIKAGPTSMKLIGADTEIDNIKKYNEIKLKIVQASMTKDEAHSEAVSVDDISEELLADMGLSVYYEEHESEPIQNYTDDTTGVFGNNNFNRRNISDSFDLAEEGGIDTSDPFVASTITNIATSISDSALDLGLIVQDSAFNSDQEIPVKDNYSDLSSTLSIQNFDLEREDNILAGLSKREIDNIPTGVRALFDSRDGGARNWLDHDRDLLKDSDLRNIYRFNQGKTAQIEYFVGTRATSTGASSETEIYEPLTLEVLESIPEGEPLLARIQPITNSTFAIGTDLGDTTEVYNQNFLITPSIAPTTTAGPTPATVQTTFTTEVVDREAQLTNYINTEMNRLQFTDLSQITTNVNESC